MYGYRDAAIKLIELMIVVGEEERGRGGKDLV